MIPEEFSNYDGSLVIVSEELLEQARLIGKAVSSPLLPTGHYYVIDNVKEFLKRIKRKVAYLHRYERRRK